jgi:hypothetical protein
MEDNMVEFSLGLAQYCLTRAMPVEFIAGDYIKREGRNQSDFQGIYHMTASIPFDIPPIEQNALALLSKCIDESQNYINVVLITAKPDAYLYDKIIAANHTGHFVAVVYFPLPKTDVIEEDIYRKLMESGVACTRVEMEP